MRILWQLLTVDLVSDTNYLSLLFARYYPAEYGAIDGVNNDYPSVHCLVGNRIFFVLTS